VSLRKTLNAISYLGIKQSTCFDGPAWRKKWMQTEQLLCWNGMTDTEHTTSGSIKRRRM